MEPSSLSYVTAESFKKKMQKNQGGVVSTIAKKADPTTKIKFAVMTVLTIVFIILAIILIPVGVSATINGKFASGLSSLIIGGLLGYAAFWMLSNMF